MKIFRVVLTQDFELPDDFELSSNETAIKHRPNNRVRLFFPEIKWTNACGLEADNKPMELRLPVTQKTEIKILDSHEKLI